MNTFKYLILNYLREEIPFKNIYYSYLVQVVHKRY
jgi:hypothetical protein